MIFSGNKFFLDNNVDLHFGPSGYVYISGPLGVISNKLFFAFEFKSSGFNRSLRASTLKHLFSSIKFGISSVTLGYYVFIDLVGLGYKIKRITNLVYRFYLGQAHYVYVYVPSDVLFWAYQNKITLFSIYADKLFSLSTSIMLLRKLNAYKLRGLIRPGQIIILKEGKQR
jgi:ribosomal protein L6P/L9E